MSAIPKIYTDSACTVELAKDGSGNYTLTLGNSTQQTNGFDGNAGDNYTNQFWLKNTGTEVYQNASLSETGEANNYVSYSLDNTSFGGTSLTFGNIAVGASVTFYVKTVIPSGATAGRNNFSFTISGESI